MSYTEADITTLERAIATGALKIRYADGREITYRSLAELKNALQTVKGEVLSRRPQVTLAKFTRD